MNDQLQLSEEMSAGTARLRVDVYGGEPREHVLDDLNFLNYRLADVRISPEVTLADPDIVWHQDGDKAVTYDGRVVTFTGPWPAGPIQKVIVAVLALRMEDVGLHPSHSAAVHYRGRTHAVPGRRVEPRQVDGPHRGRPSAAPSRSPPRRRSSTRTAGPSWARSTRSCASGRRARSAPTRPRPTRASRSSGARCPPGACTRACPTSTSSSCPAIDGNFDPATNELIPFERQFQFLHSLQNYFLTNELLAPGHVMPLVDNDRLRERRADFVARFCERPFYFIRAATPQVLLDEVDGIL